MAERDTGIAKATPGTVPGVIDTLSEGFAQLNRIAWILVLPVSLNVGLWLLPRVSVKPLVDAWMTLLSRALDMAAQSGGAALPFDAEVFNVVAKAASQFNVLTLLGTSSFYMAANPLVPWNAVKAWLPVLPTAGLPTPTVLETGGIAAIGLLLVLPLLGLVLGSLFISALGCQIRDGRIAARPLAVQSGRTFARVFIFVTVFLLVTLALSVALSILVGLITLFAPSIAVVMYGAVAFGAMVLQFWMLMYLYFTVDAMVVGGFGPLRALGSSLMVVRYGFWSALSLIGLTLFITLGLQVVWEKVTPFAWGIPLSIFGDAYVSGGLVAAGMVFYRTRLAALRGLESPLGAAGQPPANTEGTN